MIVLNRKMDKEEGEMSDDNTMIVDNQEQFSTEMDTDLTVVSILYNL